MSVDKLENYVTNYMDLRTVGIEEIVEKNDKPAPVIITVLDDLRKIFRGSYQETVRDIEQFTAKFKKLGVRLVAWHEELQNLMSDDTYEDRLEKRIDKARRAYIFIKKGGNIDHPRLNCVSYDGPFHRQVIYNAFASNNIEVLSGYKKDLIEYAKSQNCLGLIAVDTDYVIMEDAPPYLSLLKLNPDNLTTVCCEREDMLAHFQLSSKQLIFFAALAGNKIANKFMLKSFHENLIQSLSFREKRNKFHLFIAVVKFVKMFPGENELFSYLLRNHLLNAEALNSVRKSVDYFSCRLQIVPWDFDFPKKLSWDTFELFRWMNRSGYETYALPIFFDDYSDPDLLQTSSVLEPMRKKIYAVFLRETEIVKEKRYDGIFEVKLEPPPITVPELVVFWAENAPPEVVFTRSHLFYNAISPDLSPSDFLTIPEYLIVPVCALIYLQRQNGVISNEEVRWLCATILFTDNWEQAPKQMLVSPRTLQASTYFIETCFMVWMMNAMCGYVVAANETCPSKYFNAHVAFFLSKKRDRVENVLVQSDEFVRISDLLSRFGA